MDERDILDKMASVLKDKGWIKDDLIKLDENGETAGVCMQGACNLITEDIAEIGWLFGVSAAWLMQDVIENLYPDRRGEADPSPWKAVVNFNDHPDTTFEDVLLVIKHAREAV